MAGIVDVPGVEVFGKGRGRFPLPCGFVDAAGGMHRMVTLRELSGTEEDLMDDDEIPVTERTSRVLTACTEQIGTVTDPKVIANAIADTLDGGGAALTSSDRIAMLIYLRRVSVGDNYKFERRCPRCGFVNSNKSLDLRKLEITRVRDEMVGKRRAEVTLPRSGRRAIVCVLSAKREAKLTDLSLNQKDLKTAAILARLEAIEEEETVAGGGLLVPASTPEISTEEPAPQLVTPAPGAPSAPVESVSAGVSASRMMVPLDDPRVGLEVVRALPLMDRNYLRQVYKKLEADVDTKVTVSCGGKLCGVDFTFPLDLGQAFFLNPVEELSSDAELNWL